MGRAQRADIGWPGTMNAGKMREADRGRITVGLVGHGKEFGFCSSVVIPASL